MAGLALVLAVVILAGVLALTLAVRADGTTTTPSAADESSLVGGSGFNHALERAVVDAGATPSPLVDGAGFEQMVDGAVVDATRGR